MFLKLFQNFRKRSQGAFVEFCNFFKGKIERQKAETYKNTFYTSSSCSGALFDMGERLRKGDMEAC